MTISYVSGATAEATSLTMPTHQKGDLLIMFAYISASATRPTVPAGWTLICNRIGSAQGSAIAYKYATSNAEVSGVWSNANILAAYVARDSANLLMVGGVNATSGNASTSVVYPQLLSGGANVSGTSVFRQQSGDAWVVAFGGCNSSASDIETAPTGMINRLNRSGSSREIVVHDTGSNVLSWATFNQTISTAVASTAFTVEIYDSGCPKSSASIRHALSQQVIG